MTSRFSKQRSVSLDIETDFTELTLDEVFTICYCLFFVLALDQNVECGMLMSHLHFLH